MCLDDQILSEYMDGELSEPWRSQIGEHLDWCPACKKRYDELLSIKTRMTEAMLDDESIETRQERVLKYMTNNVFHKKKRFSTWIENLIHIPLKRILVPVASACAAFCFCLIFFGPVSKTQEVIPDRIQPSLSIENVTPVRLTDNYTTNETLDKYSLDDILKYLDESGYNVSISVKSINPIETGEVIKNDYNLLPTLKFPVTGSSEFGLTNKSYFTFRGDL